MAGELSLDQRKRNITVFGLEVIVGGIIKMVVFLVIAAGLGVLPEAFTVSAVYATLRWVAGGTHCNSYFRCIVVSMMLIFSFTGMGLLLAEKAYQDQLITAVFFFALVMNIIYAPMDPPQKPIKSRGKRNIIKALVSTQLVIYWLICYSKFLSDTIAYSILMGILLESITMLPPGAWLVQRIDEIIEKLERRCSV